MSKRKNYDHKKNMQRKNTLRMAKRSSALLAAAAIVVTPYVYDTEQKTLSKYTAEAANIAVLGNQTLGATYQDGVLTLRLRGNQLANIGALSNYSPNFQLPEELSSLLQNPNIRSQTTVSYSIPYAGVGGVALNNTGSVTGNRLTVNTATNSIGTNIQHTLGIAVSSPTTFTARINLANLGITELPTASDGRLDFRAITTDTLIANVDLLNRQGSSAYISTGVSDTQPPAAPVLNAVDSDDTTLSGTAEANSRINITLPDGSTATATADANGNWSAAIPAQQAGGTISATATDAAGNRSSAGTVSISNADSEPPAAPAINPVDSDDTTVSGTAEAGTAITVTLGDGSTAEATTDDAGNWTADIPTQAADTTITAVATDDTGNESEAGTITVTDADSEAPAAPEISPIDSDDTTLSGTAESGSAITITLPGGSIVETETDENGNWSAEIPAQEPDSNISVTATDAAGNQSDPGTVTVTNAGGADTVPPAAPVITPVTDEDTTLSGTAEANADIVITLPDGTTAETTADTDGNWTTEIPAQAADRDITAVAIDDAGNESEAGTITVTDADSEAPVAPEINPVDSDDTSLSGTAEANADIIVTLPDDSTVETTADADGNWTVDIPAQAADSNITAIAVDEAGNESDAGSVTVTDADADNEAPVAPEVNPVDSNDTSLSGTAEANSNITVTLPDGSVVETTADADGNWTASIPAQEAGSVISVTATDDAGNESDAGSVTVTNADTEAPTAPEVDPVDSDDTSVSGTAEPNSDIELTFSDGTTVDTRTDADGNWSVEIPPQEPGRKISVVAIDDAGNRSNVSTVVVINYDSTPPAAPEINPVNSDDTSVSGTAEPNADIVISLPDGSEVNTTADEDGNWTVDVPAQEPGGEISAIAIDEAGNQSGAGTVTVTNADTTAPDAPAINPVDSDDASLSGTAEANTDVIVTLPDGTAVRTTTDADGNWTVDIPAQNPGSVLSVVAVDEARNISAASTIDVTNADTTAPDAPEINPVDSDDTSLSGTAEANTDIIITLPNGSAVSTRADEQGNWTVDIPVQDPGAILSVVAVDEARNVSSASTTSVTNADTTAPDAPEINPADSDDTSLSGTAEANADIIITLPDGSTINTTADEQGNWTAAIPAQDPGAVLSVVAVDKARNVSGASTVNVTNADTTAPDVPEVDSIDSDDTSLSGTVEANADIIITLPDGSTINTSADEQGNWSVAIPAQTPGAVLSVVAVDEARNISGASTVSVTNADTTAPDAPQINPVDSDDTSLSGTAEANAEIIVTLPGGATISATADQQGSWSVDIPSQNPGVVLSVVAVDEARNISDASTVIVTNADITAPEAPQINPVDSDDSSLSGTAEPDASIIVTLPDGTAVRTTADIDGNWTVAIPAQDPGSILSVAAVDAAQNVSSSSTVSVTNADTTAPDAPEINPADSDDTSLSGTAEPNAEIIVTLPDGTAVRTTAEADGNWEVAIPAQDSGAVLSVVAVDAARNVSGTSTINVTNADTTAPDAPAVNSVTSNDTALSGTAEANATIIVTLPDGSTVITAADDAGNWSVAIPNLNSGDNVSVAAVDAARNISDSTAATVEPGELETPAPPIVGPVLDNDNFIFGLAGFRSYIAIYLADGTVVETRADDQGQWSAEIPPQEAGSEISIIETDEDGNSSEPTVITVAPDTEAPATPIALPVSNTDTTLTGIAEPETTVVVTLTDGTQLDTVADANGNWSIEIPLQEAGAELSIVSADSAGNQSVSQVVTVTDNIQPDIPTVDPVSNEDSSLSGDAESEATVVITLPDGTTVEAPVDRDGNWEAEIPALEPGEEITVVVTDPAGNISNPVIVPVENSDTAAPDAPTADPVTDTDTSLSGDAEPDATVIITLPDGSVVEAPVDEDGNWEAEIPVLQPGDDIIVVVTDPAGNISEPVVVPVENSDTEAPVAPVVDPVTDEDTTLSGDAEPESTLVITLPDGTTVETPVDADGNWEADIPTQETGGDIIVVVTDPAGNVSDPVIVPVENSDTEAPAAPVVDPVTDADTALSGDAEPDSTVVITLPDGTTAETPVDAVGNWEAEIPALEPGDEITVVVTDPAGNVSNPVIVPVENSDTEAPDVPTVNPVTNEDTTISGDAEPDSTVVITLPDGSAVQVPVDGDGNWETEIPTLEPGDEITVVVADPAGNVSNPAIVPVEDGASDTPAPPVVGPVTENDDTISGDGEPGSTVVITLPDGTTVETPVDEDGNWETEIPSQDPGDEVVVVITDPENGVSDPVIVPVEDGESDTPAPPVVDPVTENDDTISGDGEPGSTVVITLPDGTTVETPVDEDGNWETEIPSQEPGDEVIVVITDPDSGVSDPVIVPVEDGESDTPAPPVVDPVTENDDTISGDGEPGSTVVITLPDGTTVETPVDEDGNWETEIPSQDPGDEVVVVITDPENGVSDPVIVPVEDGESDTPAPPVVDPVTENDDTISGDGEPGSTVVITLPDGTTVETPVDEDGNWEAEIPSQDPGDEVVVVITDPEGKESDPVVVPVEDGETDTPEPPVVDPIGEGDDIISGGGTPGSTIIITLPDGTTVEVPVDEDGNWETDIPALEPGDNVTAVEIDPDGNESNPARVTVRSNKGAASSDDNDGARDGDAAILPNGSSNDSYGGTQLPQTSNNFFTSILISAGALIAGAISLVASRFRRKNQ